MLSRRSLQKLQHICRVPPFLLRNEVDSDKADVIEKNYACALLRLPCLFQFGCKLIAFICSALNQKTATWLADPNGWSGTLDGFLDVWEPTNIMRIRPAGKENGKYLKIYLPFVGLGRFYKADAPPANMIQI